MLIFTAYAPCRSSLRVNPLRRAAILDDGIRSCRVFSMPHILLQVRAFLRLMTSDETARRRADDAVMAGIVAGDTADDRAFQTTLG